MLISTNGRFTTLNSRSIFSTADVENSSCSATTVSYARSASDL